MTEFEKDLRIKELEAQLEAAEASAQETLLKMLDMTPQIMKLIEDRAKLVEAVKLAKWFLDEKELRMDLYYNLKSDSEPEEMQEFNEKDSAWMVATADLDLGTDKVD